MCNLVFLSTNCPDDLTSNSSADLNLDFCRASINDLEQIKGKLSYQNVWFLGRYGGCSCHFRHVIEGNKQFEFSVPEDWDPEEDDDIQATVAVYKVIKELVESGFRVEVIDFDNNPPEAFIDLDVNLDHVSQSSFRFFENFRFTFQRDANSLTPARNQENPLS